MNVEYGSKPVLGAALATYLKIAFCHGQSVVMLYIQGLDMWQRAGWAFVELLQALWVTVSL